MTTAQAEIRIHRLGIVRSALAGAAVVAVLFAACWIGTAVSGLAVSHMFIALFTAEPVASQAALVQGLASAIVFGAIAGALVAFFYNLFNVARR